MKAVHPIRSTVKRPLLIVLVLALAASAAIPVLAASSSTQSIRDWNCDREPSPGCADHEKAILATIDARVAQGYPNGDFQPSQDVTRGQMATFLQAALDLPDAGRAAFVDVAGTTHEDAIHAVNAAEIAGGYPDGTFRPNAAVTRGQMARFLANGFGLAADDTVRFSDVDGTAHANAISAVSSAGIAGGFEDGTYRPELAATRGQMATFLARSLGLVDRIAPPEPTEESLSGEAVDTGSRLGTAAAFLSEGELAVQRDRVANGPFRTAGDFSANSPGHWNEMAATMKLDFSSARWQGPTGIDSNGRITSGGLTNDPPGEIRLMAHDMMSAAYAAAITGNHTVAANITEEIEYQATRPNLDYSNRTLWPFNYYDDVNPLFMHTVWVKDYVLAYDITKAMGHSSPTVERWFLDLAELSEQIVHENLSRVFPDRKNDSYSSRASFVDSDMFASTRSADGELVDYARIALFFNNRRSNQAGFYGLVGVVLDDTRYKEEFKRYVREWVMFGHRVTSSDGLHGDVNRGTDSFPQLGFSYGLHAMESLIPAMDGLARQGDTSLYEFSSSDGAATPSGGTNHYKTMEGVLDTYVKWIKGSYPAQYTGSGDPPSTSIAGDAYYRIQSRNTGTGREIVNDASLLLPANYYNRTDWYDVIMRKGTLTGFTAAPQNVGTIGGWRADWRHRFLRSLDTNPYPTRG